MQGVEGGDGMCDACGEEEASCEGEYGIIDSTDMRAVSDVIVV